MPVKHAARATVDFLGLTGAASSLKDHAKYFLDARVKNRNARFKRVPAADGLPMPPPALVYLVTGQFDSEAFYNNGVLNGVLGAECIQQVVRRHGLDFNRFGKVLDFGCGCGRIMRRWQNLNGPKLYGVDSSPRLVEWCSRNLTFGEFELNVSATPLSFADATFDFIYSISVFTHLSETNQQFWMGELIRVLKPGGHLLITVHGTTRLHHLTPEQRGAFETGKVVITHSRYSGQNLCATYHPEA